MVWVNADRVIEPPVGNGRVPTHRGRCKGCSLLQALHLRVVVTADGENVCVLVVVGTPSQVNEAQAECIQGWGILRIVPTGMGVSTCSSVHRG